MGKLVGDAAVGLGWGEPVDRQAQRMQVQVAHSLKVKGVGIHEGLGQVAGWEGQDVQMCGACACADTCVFFAGETGKLSPTQCLHQGVLHTCCQLGHFPAFLLFKLLETV